MGFSIYFLCLPAVIPMNKQVTLKRARQHKIKKTSKNILRKSKLLQHILAKFPKNAFSRF